MPQILWAMSVSALPPDVRRRLCPADSSQISPGLCPGPNDWLAQRPIKGHSHRRTSGGKAEAAATKDF
ncbi:MAG TPA: hypothetical protein VN951_07750 [Pyrinomonadaceae bacterium]|nr:hypothetical protein [Pyrinomonadaceae bacterium]